MAIHNEEIARQMDRLADLLEIEGANPYRVRAYRNAARIVRDLSREVADMVAAGEDLTRIYGIGEDLANKIRSTVETGELPALGTVRERVPDELADLMHVGQLGPKRVRALYRDLGVRNLRDLEEAVRKGRVRELSGFGQKTEDRVREALREVPGGKRRMPLPEATRVAERLLEWLAAAPGVEEAVVAGSYRRRKETVGDLDILVTCRDGAAVMERFVGYEAVDRVISRGETRSTLYLSSGLQVDLRVMPRESYGAALYYFTGSKAHGVAVRAMAVREGLRINEYGVFRAGDRVAGATEEEVFAAVGLPWIPPELRESRGEIEAAQQGRLPDLVEPGDLKGDLHAHTDASDGRGTLREMADAAAARGYEYLAVTDHSQSLKVANGLDERRLREQMEAIDRLNGELSGITLLKGMEVDILEDGDLDMPDSVLRELDITVCSVHSRFGLSRQRQTRRLLTAMDNPCCNVIGHPTGRLLDDREPLDLDLEAVFRGAAERGVWLELNAQPKRLDLDDTAVRRARDLGVRIALSSDAHSAGQLEQIRFGIDQARRGWLEAPDVVNTRGLGELRKLLRERR